MVGSTQNPIKKKNLNSYKLETLEGRPIQGEFSARHLRAFTPRIGMQLAKKQKIYEEKKRSENEKSSREGEEDNKEEDENERKEDTKDKDIEEEDVNVAVGVEEKEE